MFGAPKLGRFRSLASLILVVNVVGELQRKRTLAALRGFLAAARLSCHKVRSISENSAAFPAADTSVQVFCAQVTTHSK